MIIFIKMFNKLTINYIGVYKSIYSCKIVYRYSEIGYKNCIVNINVGT